MDESNLLTFKEAAQRLSVTVSCLRDWRYRRRIGVVKVGKLVRISQAEVQRIIKAGTIPALGGHSE